MMDITLIQITFLIFAMISGVIFGVALTASILLPEYRHARDQAAAYRKRLADLYDLSVKGSAEG